jgi:hypothetical protein
MLPVLTVGDFTLVEEASKSGVLGKESVYELGDPTGGVVGGCVGDEEIVAVGVLVHWVCQGKC